MPTHKARIAALLSLVLAIGIGVMLGWRTQVLPLPTLVRAHLFPEQVAYQTFFPKGDIEIQKSLGGSTHSVEFAISNPLARPITITGIHCSSRSLHATTLFPIQVLPGACRPINLQVRLPQERGKLQILLAVDSDSLELNALAMKVSAEVGDHVAISAIQDSGHFASEYGGVFQITAIFPSSVLLAFPDSFESWRLDPVSPQLKIDLEIAEDRRYTLIDRFVVTVNAIVSPSSYSGTIMTSLHLELPEALGGGELTWPLVAHFDPIVACVPTSYVDHAELLASTVEHPIRRDLLLRSPRTGVHPYPLVLEHSGRTVSWQIEPSTAGSEALSYALSLWQSGSASALEDNIVALIPFNCEGDTLHLVLTTENEQ